MASKLKNGFFLKKIWDQSIAIIKNSQNVNLCGMGDSVMNHCK